MYNAQCTIVEKIEIPSHSSNYVVIISLHRFDILAFSMAHRLNCSGRPGFTEDGWRIGNKTCGLTNRNGRESIMEKLNRTKQSSAAQKGLTIVGVILCVVFGFMLICNLTIIIKGTLDPESPPAVLGNTPLVVLSGSMSGDAPDHIEVGDLIFVSRVAGEDLEVGNIIAFMQGKTVITHRIIEIQTGENGELLFYTKGDSNNAPDLEPVTEKELVGIYKCRIPKVGDFALLMQTPLGMAVFVGIPLVAFIIYDIIRRQRYAAKESKKTAELEAELERLRALAGEKE